MTPSSHRRVLRLTRGSRLGGQAVLVALACGLASVIAGGALADGPAPAVAEVLAGRFQWMVPAPLVSAASRPADPCYSVKDPSIVYYAGRWHLFCTIRSQKRTHQIEYLSFTNWRDADRAPRHILKLSEGYFCAPEVFYFTPQRRWYLLCQVIDQTRTPALQPAFSTTATLDNPDSWSRPELLFTAQPENVKAWIDFWVICDATRAHLFFTSNDGRMWRAETKLSDFPHGWSQPKVVLRGDIFEASHTYRLQGLEKFLTVVEAVGDGRRYYKAYLADRLDGEWQPLAATLETPFAGRANAREAGPHWTDSFSHGELLRSGMDEHLEVDPAHLRFLFQGVSDAERAGKSYGEIPWRLGVLDAPRSGHPVDAGSAKTESSRPPITGPLRVSKNPNYFQDASGAPLILCGSQTWNTLQDWGTDGTVRPLDFDAFVGFLKAHGHNFTLLWFTELPEFRGLPSTEPPAPTYTVGPFPWLRTGPGVAADGKLKFDLTKFDPAYFRRLRARVQALNHAGVYVGVYVFTAEWLLRFRIPTDGYPFSGPNNVNGVDDGYRGGPAETGLASVTMTAPNTITDFQDAYVRELIDTLNDLPNVLWITSEEAPPGSVWWNTHLIALIRAYEKGKPWQHPIGYAAPADVPDATIYNSDADWVAPAARLSPQQSCGAGQPACKVNINDSDHSYFGMWNDTPQQNRNYAWENFLNGNQVLFMDPYLVDYPRQKRNQCLAPVHGIGPEPDSRYENFRNNLGYILTYSRKLDLARVTPNSSLCSTRFCLAQIASAGAEYLVYAPSGGTFTLDLSAMPDSRTLAVEWFNPATGEAVSQDPIPAGSSSRRFSPPFRGDAVLYLVDSAGHR